MEIQGVTGDLDPIKAQRGRGPSRHPVKPVSASDTVEISQQAVDIQRVREIAAKLPEIRHERVTQAQQRVETGYYDRPDVKGSIVDQLINHFG